VLMGQDIDGEATNDQSGNSVSMNATGDRVAIGANNNDSNSGHVRIYEWIPITNLWEKIGEDIDGDTAGDRSGWSVSMNAAGNRVAIGAPQNTSGPGYTSVYDVVYKLSIGSRFIYI